MRRERDCVTACVNKRVMVPSAEAADTAVEERMVRRERQTCRGGEGWQNMIWSHERMAGDIVLNDKEEVIFVPTVDALRDALPDPHLRVAPAMIVGRASIRVFRYRFLRSFVVVTSIIKAHHAAREWNHCETRGEERGCRVQSSLLGDVHRHQICCEARLLVLGAHTAENLQSS